MMKSLKKLVFLSILGMMAFGCSDPNSPGLEYMPDMYRDPSIGTYQESDLFPDGLGSRLPAEGSIPRGFTPYPYEDNAEGYQAAGSELKNPLAFSDAHLKRGKKIYEDFCIHCHGKKGGGDGLVPQNDEWPGVVPAYDSDNLIDLPEGKIFHSITYGKGLMGAHKGQISQEDRWKLVFYVQSLQGKKQGDTADEDAEEDESEDREELEDAESVEQIEEA